LFFKAGVSDAHCGFRAIRRDALEKMSLKACGMEFASEMIIEAVRRNLRIKEVPVTYYPREGSESKLKSFSDGWRHLRFMLIYAPTYLYLLPGLAFCIFGVLMLLSGYFRVYIGYLPGFHSMLLGGFSLVIGCQVIFLGLFAKIYGVISDLFNADRIVKHVLRHLSLERGAMIGVIVFLAGFLYFSYLVIK